MKLEDRKIYQISMSLGEEVWKIVSGWDYYAKDTVGKQLIRSIDSVAANISEGFGRYHYKDSKNFNYYSRGSLYETKTWLNKANNRDLIAEEKFQDLIKSIDDLGVKLNNYINTIGKQQNKQ
jgi:four helix bundle protein